MEIEDITGWGRWRYANARDRLISGIAVGLLTAGAASRWSPWQLTALIGWDTTALVVLAWVWFSVHHFDAESTAAFATREDGSRVGTQLLLVGASVVSLIGTALTLVKAEQSSGTERFVLISAGIATIVVSWTVVHTIFMLRYAHEYYTPPVGGVDFNSDERPDYRDFAYLAFTVGMTFQVADTNLSQKRVRGTVLRHALLAYLFGAVIVGVTVNVVASLL